MTLRVLKSRIDPDFAAQVAHHAWEMRNWRAHMARVAADEKVGITGIDKHIAHPKPSSHPTIEAAVNENDEADFEVVDDGPTPQQVLINKKDVLFAAVSRAESEAIASVTPVGKTRLYSLRENDIRRADAERHVNLKPGLIAATAAAVGLNKIDVNAEIEKARPPEDTKFLAEQAARRARTDTIQRVAAQICSDIEDLTPETVDAWVMPKFPD